MHFIKVHSTSNAIVRWGAIRANAFGRVKTADHVDILVPASDAKSRECDFADDPSDATLSEPSNTHHVMSSDAVPSAQTLDGQRKPTMNKVHRSLSLMPKTLVKNTFSMLLGTITMAV